MRGKIGAPSWGERGRGIERPSWMYLQAAISGLATWSLKLYQFWNFCVKRMKPRTSSGVSIEGCFSLQLGSRFDDCSMFLFAWWKSFWIRLSSDCQTNIQVARPFGKLRDGDLNQESIGKGSLWQSVNILCTGEREREKALEPECFHYNSLQTRPCA